MVAEEIFKDMGKGETDDRHRYPLRWELRRRTRQNSVDTPNVSREDCVVYGICVLPLGRFGYQRGKAEGSGEFPVFEMVENLGNDLYRKIWG